MVAQDANTAWALFNFSMQKTDDGGTTWTRCAIDSWPDKNDIAMAPDGRTMYCVGWEGAIWASADAGLHWGIVRAPTRQEHFFGVAAPTTDVVYAAGNVHSSSWFAVVYKSTDSGSTWEKVYQSQSGADGYGASVYAADANTVWVSDGGGRVFRTVDGGASWEETSTGFQAMISLNRHADGRLYCAGSVASAAQPGFIVRSDDEGATWVTEMRDFPSWLVGITALGGEVWAVGDGGTVLRRDG